MKHRLRSNIFLTGFMASGKTRVGRALARMLKCPFVDTDDEIERKTGRSVAQIFTESGEKAFRFLEERAIARAARSHDSVIATGGGAILQRRNIVVMRRSGYIVYLTASLPLLERRAMKDGLRRRPLWPRARRLLDIRRPLYRRAADITVRAGQGSAQEVAQRIALRLPRRRR